MPSWALGSCTIRSKRPSHLSGISPDTTTCCKALSILFARWHGIQSEGSSWSVSRHLHLSIYHFAADQMTCRKPVYCWGHKGIYMCLDTSVYRMLRNSTMNAHQTSCTDLPKQKGIVAYALSPNRQRPLAHAAYNAIFNTARRMGNQFFYVAPPFIIAFLLLNWAEDRYVRALQSRATI